MNTDKLIRSTFVLDRRTHDNLRYLSDRMAVSRSALARGLLDPAVSDLVALMRMVPTDPKDVDLRQLALAGLELAESRTVEPFNTLRNLANG